MKTRFLQGRIRRNDPGILRRETVRNRLRRDVLRKEGRVALTAQDEESENGGQQASDIHRFRMESRRAPKNPEALGDRDERRLRTETSRVRRSILTRAGQAEIHPDRAMIDRLH